jgi:hypothetical protein
VPVRYLLTGEEPDAGTSLGPPRLTTIAAKVLHDKLMGELQGIKDAAMAATAGRGEALASSGTTPSSAPRPASLPNSVQLAQEAARAAAEAASHAPRWRWGMRRSSSDGVPAAAAAAAGVVSPTGAGGTSGRGALECLLSLPGRVAAGAAQQSSRATPESAADVSEAVAAGAPSVAALPLPPPLALLPSVQRSRIMSPRVSVSSIPEAEPLGTAAEDSWLQHHQESNQQEHQGRKAGRPRPLQIEVSGGSRPGSRRSSWDGCGAPAAAPAPTPVSPLAAAFAHVAASLGATPALFDGRRKGAADVGGSAGVSDSGSGLIPALPFGSSELEPDTCDGLGGGSSSTSSGPTTDGSGGGGADDAAGGVAADGAATPGPDAASESKVSPNPELLDEGHSEWARAAVLFWATAGQLCRCEPSCSRCSCLATGTAQFAISLPPTRVLATHLTLTPLPLPGPTVLDGLLRPFRKTNQRVTPSDSRRRSLASEDGITCGVCLDAAPTACIVPCRHVMCGEHKPARQRRSSKPCLLGTTCTGACMPPSLPGPAQTRAPPYALPARPRAQSTAASTCAGATPSALRPAPSAARS